MDVNCPHCGTEYEVERKDMYHYTTCEVCGKGFVIGATTSLLSSDKKTMQASRQSASSMSACSASSIESVPRSRPFTGKIGNGAARQSAPSVKFNWRNPLVWAYATCACIVGVVVLAFTITNKNACSRKDMKGTNIAQGEVVEDSNTIAEPDKSKGEVVSSAIEVATTEENIQAAFPQASDPAQSIMDEPIETVEDEADKDDAIGANDSNVNIAKNAIQAKNPLELFKFGDARDLQTMAQQDGTIRYAIKDFLGIQQMTLGYTKKNNLYSICLVSENDHYSAAESDVRVSKLMQLCDEWYDDIKWEIGTQEHDGRKFAIGRVNNTYSVGWVGGKEGRAIKNYNYIDMLFSIIPTRREKNVVGLQVNLIDNRRRRLESDYIDVDIRRQTKMSDSQYREKKEWLREQLNSHGLQEHQFKRNYECGKLYAYDYVIKKSIYTDREYVGYIYIILDNGVLKVSGDLAIDEDYAEKIIIAKLITFNKEFEGIEGEINDYRPIGPGGDIQLPCPVCHGEKNCQKGMCSCWAKFRKQNVGFISISRKDFKAEFEDYKIWYKTGQKPSRPRAQSKKNQQTRPKPKHLH